VGYKTNAWMLSVAACNLGPAECRLPIRALKPKVASPKKRPRRPSADFSGDEDPGAIDEIAENRRRQG